MNIEPIKLLKGSHKDTGQTGLGCFMNVIAYLNGEPQITDESPCVCVTVRPIAVWLNDYMTDEERPQLLPFITRAMGSATEDKDTLVRRTSLCADYVERLAARSASAEWVTRAARDAARAAAWTARAAAWAVESYAAWAVESSASDYPAFRGELIAGTLALLDAMLPPATELQQEQIDRAQRLVELAT